MDTRILATFVDAFAQKQAQEPNFSIVVLTSNLILIPSNAAHIKVLLLQLEFKESSLRRPLEDILFQM